VGSQVPLAHWIGVAAYPLMATVRILLIVFIFLLFQITFAFVICDAT
jgi:hypothetical protein